MEYVSQPYIQDDVIESREYQNVLYEEAKDEGTLVALPTGTGKTPVAVRIMADRLSKHPSSKVVMLSPTQPLVNQHAEFFKEALDVPNDEIVVFTGDIKPDEREEIWGEATVIVATPEVIENDLIGNKYTLNEVCHLTFDECHRATGDYAYTYIGERYHGNAVHPLVTGLSASPGSSRDKILDVCKNIGVTNIEVVTEEDELLADYLPETKIDYEWIDIPEDIIDAKDLIQEAYKDCLLKLKNEYGAISSARKDLPVSKLLQARGKIQKMMDNDNSDGYQAMSVLAEAQKLNHGWKTTETQSPEAAIKYFEGFIKGAESGDANKAEERIASNPKVKHALQKLRDYDETHPKFERLRSEVARTLMEDGKAIIFTESRDTVELIVDFLDSDKIKPARFVGQSDKDSNKGMSQDQQKETLKQFEEGVYNVLVSTSVAEEGLDIPTVDLVLFYEPITDAVRTIQRRGRTGRKNRGRVVVMIGRGTSDEAAYFISKNREDTMKEELSRLEEMEDGLVDKLREEQASLADFGERFNTEGQPEVYIDTRESKSRMTKKLDRMKDITVKLETLDVGDYILSDRVGIERKTLDDFIQTLVGGRGDDTGKTLMGQIGDLADNYERSMLIIEGGDGIEDLYGRARVSENALRSTIISISVDFGVSIIFTQDKDETAEIIKQTARREQTDNDREVNPHSNKKKDSLSEQQVYLVSSIPSLGPVTARTLLSEMGSVKNILNASKSDLEDIEGIGEKTALKVVELASEPYSEE